MNSYRQNEIDLLNNDFDKPNSSINFIFGRRRIGKTFLINEYTQNKQVLYLSAFETISFLLIKIFKKSIDKFFDIENFDEIDSFEEMMFYLSQIKLNEKIVIVFENIQELIKIDKDYLINLNNYWIKYLKNMNIQCIITSSFLANNFDKLQILKKAENIIKLKSLEFNIIKETLPNLNYESAMLVYSAFGTNFKYLSFYDDKKDFYENIKDLFLTYDSFLYKESMNILKNDLNDCLTYSSILYAISIGNNKIGKIARFLNLKSSYLTRYIQKLVDLMIIDKILPINENHSKSKFGRYEINDNLLKFWFCYIYPNSSEINSNKSDEIIKYIKKDFEDKFIKSTYKKHAIEILNNNWDKFLDYSPKKIGSWWNNKDIEIDFIAYDLKTITFIDCKWGNNKNIENDYKQLEEKAKKFNTQLEKKYIIFTGK